MRMKRNGAFAQSNSASYANRCWEIQTMMQTRSWAEKMYAVSGAVLGGVLLIALIGVVLSSMGYGIIWTN